MVNDSNKGHSAILVLFTLVLTGCFGDGEQILSPATGKAGDLVVVMDSSFWKGASGGAVAQCFGGPQEALPQPEPNFNVIRLTNSNFKHLFKTTRNILIIEKGKDHQGNQFGIAKDRWAKNQQVLLLYAANDSEAAKLIEKNCDNLVATINEEERSRLTEAFRKLKNLDLVEKVKEVIGIEPFVISDYKLVKKGKDFIWIRKDFEQKGHQVSMGLIFYQIPYLSEEDFDLENLMANRKERVKMVEGPVDGSHMKTYEEFEPLITHQDLNGIYTKEIRGLWNMEGAFMGGPFTHVAFVEKKGKNLICIDGYVFAPGLDKREYLRELRTIAYSAVK